MQKHRHNSTGCFVASFINSRQKQEINHGQIDANVHEDNIVSVFYTLSENIPVQLKSSQGISIIIIGFMPATVSGQLPFRHLPQDISLPDNLP